MADSLCLRDCHNWGPSAPHLTLFAQLWGHPKLGSQGTSGKFRALLELFCHVVIGLGIVTRKHRCALLSSFPPLQEPQQELEQETSLNVVRRDLLASAKASACSNRWRIGMAIFYNVCSVIAIAVSITIALGLVRIVLNGLLC